MKSLKSLPSSTLLSWWATASPHEEYSYPMRQARNIGYMVSTDQVRREIKQRLKDEQLLPVGRPATPKDYDRIKVTLLAAVDRDIR